MKPLVLIASLLVASFAVSAAETNTIYVTDEGGLFLESDARGRYMDPAKVEAARKMRECLPAADFPEGNWGQTNGGFQLSLRLNKTSYTNDEPIVATLLLRNVTNCLQMSCVTPLVPFDGPIRMRVTSDAGVVIPEKAVEVVVGPGIGAVFPGTQRKYVEHLNRAYALTNGTYTAQAFAPVNFYSPLWVYGKAEWEVRSAAVPLRIEESSPAPDK